MKFKYPAEEYFNQISYVSSEKGHFDKNKPAKLTSQLPVKSEFQCVVSIFICITIASRNKMEVSFATELTCLYIQSYFKWLPVLCFQWKQS